MPRVKKSISVAETGVLVGLLCLLCLSILWYGGGGMAYETYSLKKRGLHVRDQIEDYRATHGKLPPNLTTLGIEETEAGPIYYLPKVDSSYELYFNRPGTVGESTVYLSTTQKWNH